MRRIETNTTESIRTIPSRIPEEILMDEIKKEYQRGWNEAIEAAVKVAEKLAAKEQARGCDYEFPPAAFIEVAESINKLKRG